MKIALVTDAWSPQINGVVTTLSTVRKYFASLAESKGSEIKVFHPGMFRTVQLPNYKDISVAVTPWRIKRLLEDFQPDCVHLATEGPLGLWARHYLVQNNKFFTTSLHTKFPEYINARIGLPVRTGYKILRWFHSAASETLVTTPSMKKALQAEKFENLSIWGRGVDSDEFNTTQRNHLKDRSIPSLLYVGRVAIEKNIEEFLKLNIPSEKIVVGDGPLKKEFEKKYPNTTWVGFKRGKELSEFYANADVFVFPSLTDTFGVVMLEALACGTPVAAFPVTGPKDVIEEGKTGSLNLDLEMAVKRALLVDRTSCRQYAIGQSWKKIAERFASILRDIDTGKPIFHYFRPL